MSNVPSELKYTNTHEWAEEEGFVTVGITQSLLGDLVFVELPELHDELVAGEDAAVVESVKTASDVYALLLGPWLP